MFWVAIPCYDNGKTLRAIAEGALKHTSRVLVVDDGSAQPGVASVLEGLPVEILRFEENQGKGAAIKAALRHAKSRGGTTVVTLDADGQHDPDDIPKLVEAGVSGGMVIGVRQLGQAGAPWSSRIGRSLAGVGVGTVCGKWLADTQSGFRAYPVDATLALDVNGNGFDFETEVIVMAVRAGIPIVETDIRVRYFPRGERVSHFKMVSDTFAIAMVLLRLYRHDSNVGNV